MKYPLNFRQTLTLVLLGLAGCATTPAPEVNLVNVQFTSATVLETTAEFTLRISNDTPEPLALEGAAHKIYLNGLYIGQGLDNQALEVPRLATGTQKVTVHLSNLRLATRIKAIIESRRFDYKIASTFYTPTGRRQGVSEGRLDLQDFAPTPKPAASAPPP